jgi:hypothetical protein
VWVQVPPSAPEVERDPNPIMSVWHGRPSLGSEDRPSFARRTAGNRPGAAAPRDPARLRCATSLVGKEDLPPKGERRSLS